MMVINIAPLPKDTEFGSSKQAPQLSPGLLCLLCAVSLRHQPEDGEAQPIYTNSVQGNILSL
jgi:hypothetical protein